MTVGDAVSLHGQVVRVTVPAEAPVYTCAGWTVTAVTKGGAEMCVQLFGGPDIDRDETLTVVGVMRVTNTPAAVANGVNVPAATNVVVFGVRVK